MRVDDNGWLIGDAADPVVKRYPTVRTYPLTTPAPLGLVWRTTDGTGGPGYAEDPGPIWKQTVLPRVLNRVFGSAASASPRLT